MSTMKALVVVSGKTATVQDIERPVPGEGEVLVKVTTIAQNPTDWVRPTKRYTYT